MNIVVLVKQVPDSGAERSLAGDGWSVDRSGGTNVINEMDEYAIEEALRLKDETGAQVTLLTVGPDHAVDSIRKALSMGPDAAVHVSDEAVAGSDALGTAKVIAAALGTLEYDLILSGAESTDGGVQVLPHLLAELLDIAALTGARKVTVEDGGLLVERQTEDGYEVLRASGKAIVSVWDTINTPRYPSLKGIMAAKRKPVTTLTLADLGVDAATVGRSGAATTVLSAEPRPARGAGVKVADNGDGGDQLVAYLTAEKFV
ncbi:electron transfer flavoprotein subunit beta [Actinorhabdospora filicis]|uniref:Electron transfer flavoprotein subunit beta n=1 Tax=Actinorhabdospora filicis TaxID=1785913 RepID=A0A9W6SEK7_9ACTN|nr:electron transfer flavoprotein subunit beta/FixA family protein [Actinorhabdospora filicis]GLZ75775.1 electron transfer flavoprotein subunit beta [Actinorhabdospora filicis]